MRAHADDSTKSRYRIFEARTEGRAQADPEKSHLADRTGRERFRPAEPSARADVFNVRFPSTGDQEINIEEVTQGSSSSSAMTLSVVIAGAPFAATRTGRPNFPCLSFARGFDSRRRTNPRPSSAISTLSPGRRLSAFRNWAGITSCPLVESLEPLIDQVLHVLPCRARKEKSAKQRSLNVAGRRIIEATSGTRANPRAHRSSRGPIPPETRWCVARRCRGCSARRRSHRRRPGSSVRYR